MSIFLIILFFLKIIPYKETFAANLSGKPIVQRLAKVLCDHLNILF